jgi:hypothetical protein
MPYRNTPPCFAWGSGARSLKSGAAHTLGTAAGIPSMRPEAPAAALATVPQKPRRVSQGSREDSCCWSCARRCTHSPLLTSPCQGYERWMCILELCGAPCQGCGAAMPIWARKDRLMSNKVLWRAQTCCIISHYGNGFLHKEGTCCQAMQDIVTRLETARSKPEEHLDMKAMDRLLARLESADRRRSPPPPRSKAARKRGTSVRSRAGALGLPAVSRHHALTLPPLSAASGM